MFRLVAVAIQVLELTQDEDVKLADLAKSRGEGFNLNAYWHRCLHSAAAARRLAAKSRQCDPEEAFIAALMQDVGMLAMHASATRRASGRRARVIAPA